VPGRHAAPALLILLIILLVKTRKNKKVDKEEAAFLLKNLFIRDSIVKRYILCR